MGAKLNVGIIGCGDICGQYVQNINASESAEVVSVCDLDPDRAQAAAGRFGLRAVSLAELLADPGVQIVVNLTNPAAHAALNLQVIQSGKHVYSEKPLAITLTDAFNLRAAAQEKGVRVGAAPDTFLGGSLQTCRELLDQGAIGRPIAAAAFLATHGPEETHPNPAFYYQPGAGPMLDLGPYTLTSLVALFGPALSVAASARTSFTEREIHTQPLYGEKIRVEVPTHIQGVVDFESGLVASVTNSFDVWASRQPLLEIYGSEGSLSLPGPNKFNGPVLLKRAGEQQWSTAPLVLPANLGRGIGVVDLAEAIQTGRPHRANAELACHVLDLLHAFIESSHTGRRIAIESRFERW